MNANKWRRTTKSPSNDKNFSSAQIQPQALPTLYSLPTLLSWVVQLPQAKLHANVFIQKNLLAKPKEGKLKSDDGKTEWGWKKIHETIRIVTEKREKKKLHVVESHTVLRGRKSRLQQFASMLQLLNDIYEASRYVIKPCEEQKLCENRVKNLNRDWMRQRKLSAR